MLSNIYKELITEDKIFNLISATCKIRFEIIKSIINKFECDPSLFLDEMKEVVSNRITCLQSEIPF